ncbi:hypothetical protein PLIP_b0395 [Pseudoalteromonas lipolytica LMEB 39]|nr:hypothetical protein [Pseudoalteromonas lipolytica LMEB 39]
MKHIQIVYLKYEIASVIYFTFKSNTLMSLALLLKQAMS